MTVVELPPHPAIYSDAVITQMIDLVDKYNLREDQGDQCYRCSQFFYPDVIHRKCGRPWKDHSRHSQEFYAGWSECPDEGRDSEER